MHTRIENVLARKGREVHGVLLGSPVSEAAKKMAALKIGSMVVRSDDAVVGILTERDLARRVCAGALDMHATLVDTVMTSPVAFVTPATTVAEAMAVMSDTHCRHMPVLADGKLVGLISLGDLIRTVTADMAADVNYLKDYILRG